MARKADPNVAFIGSREAGKTRAALHLLRCRARVIYIDPTDTLKGSITVWTVEDVLKAMRDYSTYFIVWRTGWIEDSKLRVQLDRVLAYSLQRREWITIAVDEFSRVNVQSGRPSAQLNKALRLGRHRKLSVWLMSQRAMDFGPSIRQAMDYIYIFRQPEVRDLQHLRAVHPELLQSRALPNYHYLVYSQRTASVSRHLPMKL